MDKRTRKKMCITVKPHNIRDMTKDMEQVEMKIKASMPKKVTLSLCSPSSAASESASDPSELKKRRGSTSWF